MPAHAYDDPLTPRMPYPHPNLSVPLELHAHILDLARMQNELAALPTRRGGRGAVRNLANAQLTKQRSELRVSIEQAKYHLANWCLTSAHKALLPPDLARAIAVHVAPRKKLMRDVLLNPQYRQSPNHPVLVAARTMLTQNSRTLVQVVANWVADDIAKRTIGAVEQLTLDVVNG